MSFSTEHPIKSLLLINSVQNESNWELRENKRALVFETSPREQYGVILHYRRNNKKGNTRLLMKFSLTRLIRTCNFCILILRDLVSYFFISIIRLNEILEIFTTTWIREAIFCILHLHKTIKKHDHQLNVFFLRKFHDDRCVS